MKSISACTDYVVVFYSFYTLPAEVQMKVIGGPGLIVEKSTLQGNGYVNKFIVVNQATGLIYSIMDNPDVSGIPVEIIPYIPSSCLIWIPLHLSELLFCKFCSSRMRKRQL